MIKKLADKTGFSQKDVRTFLAAFKDVVKEELQAGRSVTLREFGSFKPKHVKRSGAIQVKGSVKNYSVDYHTITFHPSKVVKW